MKKTLVLFLSMLALQMSAQNFAAIDKSIMDIVYFPQGAHRIHMAKTAEDKAKIMPKIKIIYSRPLLNGRKAFGELVKFDQAWRLGANESTEITFYQAVKIGDAILAPGRYTLYCTPSATSWKLKVHPNLDGWGVVSGSTKRRILPQLMPIQQIQTQKLKHFQLPCMRPLQK